MGCQEQLWAARVDGSGGRKPGAIRERDRERAKAAQSADERNFGGLEHYTSLLSMTRFEEVAFEGVSRQG